MAQSAKRDLMQNAALSGDRTYSFNNTISYKDELEASAEGISIYIEDSAFKSGDNIAYNSPGYLELKNCHYINNIGLNVTNYQEIGTIAEDIVE